MARAKQSKKQPAKKSAAKKPAAKKPAAKKPAAAAKEPDAPTPEPAALVAAGRRFTDVELAALVTAWNARDDETLARIGSAAGVLLTSRVLVTIASKGNHFAPEEILATIGDALADPSGIATREEHGFMRSVMLLAVTHGNKLVLGLARTENAGDRISNVWPQLSPWYRDLARNRPRIESWLAEPARDTYHSYGRFEFDRVTPTDAATDDNAQIAALVTSIVANPADDELRLVLADILQQRGDPQGEYIVLSVNAAKADGFDARKDLFERARKIESVHGERFAGDVARCTSDYSFERGFVESVTMTASAFAANGERIFTAHPIVRLLLRPLTDATLARLAKAPALDRVRSLWLDHDVGREKSVALAPLGASPHLARLEQIRIARLFTNDWVAACGALRAPMLDEIIISDGNFDIRALGKLASNAGLPKLSTIVLRDSQWSGPTFEWEPAHVLEAFEALATRDSLRTLTLEHCNFVGPEAIAQLYAGPGGRAIEKLEVSSKRFDDDALQGIVAGGSNALRELEASNSGVKGRGLLALLCSPAGARIRSLDAGYVELDMPDFAERLARELPRDHPLADVRLGGLELHPPWIA